MRFPKNKAVRYLLVMSVVIVSFLVFRPIAQAVAMPIHVSLNGEFVPEVIDPIIQQLRNASFYDTIIIDVNSPGGRVDCLQRLLAAMKQTSAKVIVEVDSYAASAAADLTTEADHRIVSPHAILVYHIGEICPAAAKSLDECKKLIGVDPDPNVQAEIDVALGFLKKALHDGDITQEEYNAIFLGADIYVSGARLKNR